MSVRRFDAVPYYGVEKTEQGYLRAHAKATRAGVFVYHRGDGTVQRELRMPEHVFDAASLKTLAGIVVTDDHPPEALNPGNTAVYAKGFTSDSVEQSDDYVQLTVTVTDSALIEKITSNEQAELSCGYYCDVEPASGVFNGEHYDAVQKNIRYNHLAVVKRGRAGPEARIKLDSNDAVLVDGIRKNERTQMGAKIKIDSVEYEIPEGVAAVVNKKLIELDEALKSLKSANDSLQASQGKTDALEAEAASLKLKIDELSKVDTKAMVELGRKRIALEEVAAQHLDGSDFSAISDSDLKKKIIQKLYPSLKIDEKSEAYIDAAFDAISVVSGASKNDGLTQRVGAELVRDSKTVDYRAKFIEAQKNLWKQSGGNKNAN